MIAFPPDRRPLGPPEREPHYTIYVDPWYEARRCAAALPGRLRRIYGDCLDYVEAGWAILRPVALAAEDALAEDSYPRATYHLCIFVEADLVDLFRSVACGCRDGVPGYEPGHVPHTIHEPVDDGDELQRLLHVLGVAAGNPGCPASLRATVPAAVTAYDQWLAGLGRVVAPIDAYEEYVRLRVPPLRFALGRLRGLVPRRTLRVLPSKGRHRVGMQ